MNNKNNKRKQRNKFYKQINKGCFFPQQRQNNIKVSGFIMKPTKVYSLVCWLMNGKTETQTTYKESGINE